MDSETKKKKKKGKNKPTNCRDETSQDEWQGVLGNKRKTRTQD